MPTKKKTRKRATKKRDIIPMDRVRKLFELGMTEAQVAEFFEISSKTLDVWKRNEPDLRADLMRWKDHADAKVERSLYQSAIGYQHPDEKVFIYHKKVTETKPDGTVLEYEKPEVIRVETTRHHPPNPTSIIVWLTNRLPGDWKRTRQEAGKDPLSVKVLNIIQERKKNTGKNGKNARRHMGQADIPENAIDVTSSVNIDGGGLTVVK